MTPENPPKEKALSRWSKRKLAVRKAEEASRIELDNIAELEPQENPQALEKKQQENRSVAEAIDFSTLDFDSDFSVFMKDGVPDALRRRAYRLLWRSNPILANLDGLNDYDDDFADASLIMKTFKSAWKIGKGYDQGDSTVEEKNDRIAEDESETDEETPIAETDKQEEIPPLDEVDAAEDNMSNEPATLPLSEQIDAEVHLETLPAQTQKVSLRHRLMLGGDDTV